jgi:pyruvate/2-oxoglutarate dehydrogenase complex dihydrolipoamide dehydrogenase (E3) component
MVPESSEYIYTMKKFDSIIIGSGQAGTPLAFKIAGEGHKVALIEKEHYGGTCVNTGCTPTKAYVASARRMFDAMHGDALGVQIPSGARAVLPKIRERKDKIVEESVKGIKKGLENEAHITTYFGEAVFTGSKKLRVNGKEISADTIYINVGGRPRMPKEYAEASPLDNRSILELTELPEHLVVVGGGYIGLEFGQMFRRFGSKVTIVEKGSRIIGQEDEDVSGAIREILEKEGVEFRLNATCMSAKKLDDGRVSVQVDCEEGEPSVEGSHVLLAIGRDINSDLLQLEKTGVAIDVKGFIKVNDSLETNVPGIYALGDCNGKGAFTHTSYNDYEIVAANRFENAGRKVSDRIQSYALFIDPPLGSAGMTLAEAKKKGGKLLVNDRPMSKVARAKEKGETQGFMRVIVDAETEEILGASILGVGGDEIISGILNTMYAGAPYTTIRDSVQIHPTVAELIPTLLEGLEEA